MAVMDGKFRLAADEIRRIECAVCDGLTLSVAELRDKYHRPVEEVAFLIDQLRRLGVSMPPRIET